MAERPTSGQQGVSNGNGFTAVTGLLAETVPLVVVTTLRGGMANGSTVHVNGAAGATFTSVVRAGGTRMSVGNIQSPDLFGTQWSFDGHIAEVRIYGDALADADRLALEDTLKAKYVP